MVATQCSGKNMALRAAVYGPLHPCVRSTGGCDADEPTLAGAQQCPVHLAGAPHPTPARGGPAGVTAGVAVDFCGQQT